MRIAILDDYQDAVRHLDCFDMVRDHDVQIHRDPAASVGELAARLARVEAVVVIRERTHIDARALQGNTRLRVISQTGGGVGNIDVEACTRQGIAVACARGGTPAYQWASSYASGEFTWTMILCALRRIVPEVLSLRSGGWQTGVGTTVRGRILGILGYGRIGAQVAGYGKAFGMRVIAYGRAGSMERAHADGVEVACSQRELFERSDVLSVHVALTPESTGLIGGEDLAAMKRDALFVNTARARIVAPGALVAALRAGRPGAAAVDVYEDEPLPPGDALVAMPNVLCTPHIGFVEKDSYETSFRNGFEQVLRYFSGDPLNIVNPSVLAHGGQP